MYRCVCVCSGGGFLCQDVMTVMHLLYKNMHAFHITKKVQQKTQLTSTPAKSLMSSHPCEGLVFLQGSTYITNIAKKQQL